MNGKTNPSNIKAMATWLWLTFVLLITFSDIQNYFNYLFLILNMVPCTAVPLPLTSFKAYTLVSPLKQILLHFQEGRLVWTSSLFVQQPSLKSCNITCDPKSHSSIFKTKDSFSQALVHSSLQMVSQKQRLDLTLPSVSSTNRFRVWLLPNIC